jgi:hypothetical protein
VTVASLAARTVSVGFQGGRGVASFALALVVLLGLLRRLGVDIGLLGMRPVFVVHMVLGMDKGGLLALQSRVDGDQLGGGRDWAQRELILVLSTEVRKEGIEWGS